MLNIILLPFHTFTYANMTMLLPKITPRIMLLSTCKLELKNLKLFFFFVTGFIKYKYSREYNIIQHIVDILL